MRVWWVAAVALLACGRNPAVSDRTGSADPAAKRGEEGRQAAARDRRLREDMRRSAEAAARQNQEMLHEMERQRAEQRMLQNTQQAQRQAQQAAEQARRASQGR